MSGLVYILSIAIYYFFRVLNIAILVFCIGSWFVRPGSKLFYYWRKLGYLLSPLFYPAQFLLNKLHITERLGIDFSPWLTVILLDIVYNMLMRLLGVFYYF